MTTITWHKCSDQMPDDDESVLLATDDGEVVVGYHGDDEWWEYGLDTTIHCVTHWADLPAHPDDQRPDCRTCDRYAHYRGGHFCRLCTRAGVLVCITGSEYQPADPVRLYDTARKGEGE
jgi:hypothetical protein